MKELIRQALETFNVKVTRSIPQTKIVHKDIDISEVTPNNLDYFMKENNIPDTAHFDTHQEEGSFEWPYPSLRWKDTEATTQEDNDRYIRKRFKHGSFKAVYEALTFVGYKRVGCNTSYLREFKDTTIYEMFVNKDYNRLAKYYSLFFKL